ncbi:ABC transporter ATP-binding protein [Canibacter sp. lx-72]|uniref:ABC transporter ATP-binding protein n=1 Tax=Canibacter zhuwentaonis TaxID=2837491 RepID=UPI001BDCEF9A|nr:ABC transporter ATP-binding protein [Canibacter zhuwentaonis]MBT1018060.1 ABC transporter ATP-binding protein [Canibacter zhuwentaonis]
MENNNQPSRKERLKPLELVGFSAVLAIFAGVVVMIVTRDIVLRVPVTVGVVFIVALLALSLLGLSVKPNPEDAAVMRKLREGDAQEGDSAEGNIPGNWH